MTDVVVVGAGGTGSIFVSHLCRIHSAWTALGGRPFSITIYDPDTVSRSNLGRQAFCEADIGSNKAAVLAQRARAFFGIPIESQPTKYRTGGDFVVGCVDNLTARRVMAENLAPSDGDEWQGYWMDIGNTNDRGQVILGGYGLPSFFDLHPEMKDAKEPTNLPSCSVAEAISKQDLFINSTVANLGGHLLWQLMRKGGLNHHGYYANLTTGRTVPIAIP